MNAEWVSKGGRKMTNTIKRKEVNGNVIAIEQEKFSMGYQVSLYDKFGHTDKRNYYGTIEDAKPCFYRYCKYAKEM